MPKAAPPNSCATCLQRKVKCDGARPVCRKCAIKNRDCVRPGKGIRFVVHSKRSTNANTANHLGEYESKDSRPSTSQSTRHSAPTDHIQSLASFNPTQALCDLEVAKLFAHYIDVLAPWYDLNDPGRTFAIVVPETAIQIPVLFKAIIAFSACHWNKTKGSSEEYAAIFHAACVAELLQSLETQDIRFHSSKLAATCLLRSYELINGGPEMESHLLGAFSFAVREPINFSKSGMLQVGAWNYLREEITVGLMQRRGVRIGQIFDSHIQSDAGPIFPSDRISYLLARIINFCFPDISLRMSLQERQTLWSVLNAEVAQWKNDLPVSFEPFSLAAKPGNPFPSLWMLQPWHVAAQQYRAVAETLLTIYNPCPEGGHLSRRSLAFAEEQALRICGLAWTNDNDAARVNAFGPIAFCGRYLSLRHHQKALVDFLFQCSLPTAWPVDEIVNNLNAHWTSSC